MAKEPEIDVSRPPLKSPAPGSGPGSLDRKKLALIHIVKKELGISDPDYRCLLKRIAGVESSKDLDEAGFRKMMRFFVRSDYYRVNASGMTLKQKLFIKSLAGQIGWEETHLRNFVRKYYRRDGLDVLTRREASHLIESLKAIRAHGVRVAGSELLEATRQNRG